MSWPRSLRVAGCALVSAMLAAPTMLGAQGRFKALAHDDVGIVPNLRIVTILDTIQNACYLLFVVEPDAPAGARAEAPLPDIDRAAAWRDRRLSELNDHYEQAIRPIAAGGPVSVLRYELDAWKIQSEFERILREHELARLENKLQRIAAAPTLTVSGPTSCGRPAAPSTPPR